MLRFICPSDRVISIYLLQEVLAEYQPVILPGIVFEHKCVCIIHSNIQQGQNLNPFPENLIGDDSWSLSVQEGKKLYTSFLVLIQCLAPLVAVPDDSHNAQSDSISVISLHFLSTKS